MLYIYEIIMDNLDLAASWASCKRLQVEFLGEGTGKEVMEADGLGKGRNCFRLSLPGHILLKPEDFHLQAWRGFRKCFLTF